MASENFKRIEHNNDIESFFNDIRLLFYKQTIVYVDASAFTGMFYRTLVESGTNIREAYLIESNRVSYARLQAACNQMAEGNVCNLYNIALSDRAEELTVHNFDSVSRVVMQNGSFSDGCRIKASTLDKLSEEFTTPHINILKIEADGTEIKILTGADDLLRRQKVDVIYIEAGMDKDNKSLAYYQDIEVFLKAYGYKIFKIYQQKYEWAQNSPFLRCVNIAFMSEALASRTSYGLVADKRPIMRELKTTKALLEIAEKQQDNLTKKAENLECQLAEQKYLCTKQAQEHSRMLESNLLSLQALEEKIAQLVRTMRQAEIEKKRALNISLLNIDFLQEKINERDKRIHALLAENKRIAAFCKKHTAIEDHEREMRAYYAAFDTVWDKKVAEVRRRKDALQKIRQMENYLSYKLGSAMVKTLSQYSPIIGWIKLPFALMKARHDYKQSGLLSAALPTTAHYLLSGAGAIEHIPLKTRLCHYHIETGKEAAPLYLIITPLCVKEKAVIEMEVRVSGGAVTERCDFVQMVGGVPYVLTADIGPSTKFAVSFKKTRGVAAILKVELSARRDGISDLPVIGKSILEMNAELDSPACAKRSILYFAQKKIEEGNFEEAIAYAEKNACAIDRPGINILLANKRLDRDTEWLKHTNTYLSRFGISPLQLQNGDEERFYRLSSPSVLKVEAGPLVSVIMPAFNAERTLEVAAKSILNQTWRPIELIIVNDQSADNTAAIIKKLERQDNRVKGIHNKVNVGPYVSKNIALNMALGEYITGHDADDWAHPERIERHMRAQLQTDGQVKASLTYMLRIQENGFFSHVGKVGPFSPDGIMRLASISCLFNTWFLKSKLGSWDSVRFGADSEIIARSKMLLGEREFAHFSQMGMLCLDLENSLTNNQQYGVSKIKGLSPTRKMYRENFQHWHDRYVAIRGGYVPFPQTERIFEAPEEMRVAYSDVCQNLSS